MNNLFKNQSGASLVAVMVAIGIGGIIIAVIVSILESSLQRVTVMIRAADERDLRLFIAVNLDCTKTKDRHPTCAGASINLVQSDNTVLIPAAGRRIGKYLVRPSCVGGLIVPQYQYAAGTTWKDLFTIKAPFTCNY